MCAFFGCERLRDVRLNEGLVVLGEEGIIDNEKTEGYVFVKSGIESIVFPSTLREIPEDTCRECGSLKNVTFREGLEGIGIGAFWETDVESVVLPKTLRRISQAAFCKCASLRTAKFSEGLTVLGGDEYSSDGKMISGVFEGSALESVLLPKTLKRIEYRAFEDCENLKSILLLGGLEFIGEKAFFNARLTSALIPKNVTEIADRAFYKNRLRRVTFEEGSRLRSVGDKAFGGNDPLSPDEVEFPRGAHVSEDVFEETWDIGAMQLG